MNKRIVRTLSVALLAAAAAFAQGSQRLTVQIPFGFHVGKSILPAGGYTVGEAAPSVLRLRSEDSKSSVMIVSHPVGKGKVPEQGKLVFNKYGDEYFLSQVWTPGVTTGSELGKTKREYQVAARANRGTESIVASK